MRSSEVNRGNWCDLDLGGLRSKDSVVPSGIPNNRTVPHCSLVLVNVQFSGYQAEAENCSLPI